MPDRAADRSDTWGLAIVFGLASVPWTYGFVAGLELPLWPSFIAAATFYAAGRGRDALVRGYAGNLLGILYAAATLAIVDGFLGGSALALALVVGVFMFIASLHPLVAPLSFAPAGFLGYATLFGVHAAGATAVLPGLAGETLAAVAAMLIGAAIGRGTDVASRHLAGRTGSVSPG